MENRGYPFIYEDSEWELFYVFLDETIQLGVPEADVWEDDQNIFHERYGFQRYDNYSAMMRKHFFYTIKFKYSSNWKAGANSPAFRLLPDNPTVYR